MHWNNDIETEISLGTGIDVGNFYYALTTTSISIESLSVCGGEDRKPLDIYREMKSQTLWQYNFHLFSVDFVLIDQ